MKNIEEFPINQFRFFGCIAPNHF